MQSITENIPGYAYGKATVAPSNVSLAELESLKTSAGFTEQDWQFLRLAGEVLADQTEKIVNQWRSGIIASIPHLARHSRTPEGDPIPEYLAKSNLRFQQWILDTCTRPYDQDWLNYQQEIAIRHTAVKKNQTDDVNSTSQVPLSDIIAFVAVMNETIKPYFAAKGHSAADVERMHLAWCKSMQLQMALWVPAYMDANRNSNHA
ncbi:protoglobin [Acidisarcina polymorpha]|uniref:Protoglobin n=1 Tax=Acidisarcina polymorpha TaxID=2211140 RepID=A0A2Z5G093_9BACT|nr:protoglobin domain-containing protein [Acidisarcina polymorpha]AXC12548.1 protoglobin [Acidisarcina polymorpha]